MPFCTTATSIESTDAPKPIASAPWPTTSCERSVSGCVSVPPRPTKTDAFVTVSANSVAFVRATPAVAAVVVSVPWRTSTVPTPTSEPTTLNETEPCACAAAFAPSACQSSFASVVAAPAAVVTLFSASEAPETPSESVGARPTSSAERPAASTPR